MSDMSEVYLGALINPDVPDDVADLFGRWASDDYTSAACPILDTDGGRWILINSIQCVDMMAIAWCVQFGGSLAAVIAWIAGIGCGSMTTKTLKKSALQ